jgi:hypothetical protein
VLAVGRQGSAQANALPSMGRRLPLCCAVLYYTFPSGARTLGMMQKAQLSCRGALPSHTARSLTLIIGVMHESGQRPCRISSMLGVVRKHRVYTCSVQPWIHPSSWGKEKGSFEC